MTSWRTCSTFFSISASCKYFFLACSLVFLIYACHERFYLHANWDVSALCFRPIYTFSPASSLFVFIGTLISLRFLKFPLFSLEQSIHDAQSVKSEMVLWHSWKWRNVRLFIVKCVNVWILLFWLIMASGGETLCIFLKKARLLWDDSLSVRVAYANLA